MAIHELDARGLVCPLPVLRANRMLRSLAAGDELHVWATDPAAPTDFIRFCEAAGHTLLGREETGDGCLVRIRKRG
jgi:tRNA 2-thiouridine synthesizing protein A